MKVSSIQKLVLVAPYPPPYGGVSVHVERLCGRLRRLGIPHEVRCNIHDPGRNLFAQPSPKNWWKHIEKRTDVLLHLHSPVRWPWLLNAVAGPCRRRTVLTVHGVNVLENQLARLSPLRRAALVLLLRNLPRVIAVGPPVRQLLVSLGVQEERITEIVPFLPPSPEPEDWNRVPEATRKFVQEHHPVVSLCAYRLQFYRGVDTYGLDMALNLCARLKERFSGIGLLCVLAETGSREYLEELRRRASQMGLGKRVRFAIGEGPFHPVLAKSHLLVRPTATDGYGVSVAEALSLGVPALASDVCARPPGAVLFASRNEEQFYERARQILEDTPQRAGEPPAAFDPEEGFRRIFTLYGEMGLRVPEAAA